MAEALHRTGQRAVVGLGWSRPPAADSPLPASIFLLESIPHAWLFERVRAVVHHGGAGTLHAGLAAGRPTVVVPHHADQPAWGQRVWELGVGSRPIPRSQLTAARLAAAIRYVLQPAVVARAAALGELIRQEDGVATAVRMLHAYGAHRNGLG